VLLALLPSHPANGKIAADIIAPYSTLHHRLIVVWVVGFELILLGFVPLPWRLDFVGGLVVNRLVKRYSISCCCCFL
jgi:hypothetical protein